MKTIQRALRSATCLVLLAGCPALASAQSVVRSIRGPYLQTATPDAVTVVWATDAPTSSEVRYGASPSALDRVVDVAQPATQHEVTLTGLTPDTRYYYAVGAVGGALAGDRGTWLTTAPLAGARGKVRVWSLGDPGNYGFSTPVRDAMLAYLGGRPPDLLIHTGDLNHGTGLVADDDRFFFQPLAGVLRSTPLWPTMGNHDGWTVDLDDQTGAFFELFALPADGEAGGVGSGTEAYYSWDHGNIHFVALETYWWDDAPDGPMMEWLEDDLAATDQEWLVAYLHYPPYTRSHYNSDTAPELIAVHEVILPVLEAAATEPDRGPGC